VADDIATTVREVCLGLPEAEEFVSHGAPNFRVRKGKVFAVYAVNTHGDGRVALWLNAPPGAQALHCANEPGQFFVPPYVGPRGWLGVCLDQGLSWTRIAGLVREAYEHTAPARMRALIKTTATVTAPTRSLAADELDPMQTAAAQKMLAKVRKICLALPETSEQRQFGFPVWRAGKRCFAQLYLLDRRLSLAVWTGAELQSMLIEDPRFRVPPYLGHQGWTALDVSKRSSADEMRGLIEQSYRHFALKRMLVVLDGA